MAYTVKKWNEILNIISGKNQKNVVNDNGKYPIYGSGGVMGKADSIEQTVDIALQQAEATKQSI